MTVTQIVPVDKRRSKVFLDEDLAFVLYRGELRQYQIKEGEELEEQLYDEIVDTVLCKRARERVLYLLKASDKTEQELRRKLQDGFYPEKAVNYAINFVKDYHYIDDRDYARRYVESQSSKKSRRQIGYNLQQKGLPKEIIKELLEEGPVDEQSQICQYLKKKGYLGRELDRTERQKAMQALGRKGFDYEEINRAMRECCSDDYE